MWQVIKLFFIFNFILGFSKVGWSETSGIDNSLSTSTFTSVSSPSPSSSSNLSSGNSQAPHLIRYKLEGIFESNKQDLRSNQNNRTHQMSHLGFDLDIELESDTQFSLKSALERKTQGYDFLLEEARVEWMPITFPRMLLIFGQKNYDLGYLSQGEFIFAHRPEFLGEIYGSEKAVDLGAQIQLSWNKTAALELVLSTYYGQVLQKELGYEAPAEKMPKIVSLRYSKNKWSAFATYLDRRFFRGLDTRAIGAGFHLNEGEVFQTGIKVSTLAEIWSMTELTPVGTGQITNSFYVYPEISWKVFAIGQLASESKRTFGSTAGSTRRQLTTKLSIKANDFLRLEAENTKRWEEFDRGSRIQLGNELTARILVEIENSSKSSL